MDKVAFTVFEQMRCQVGDADVKNEFSNRL